jgi:hypothetical protein
VKRKILLPVVIDCGVDSCDGCEHLLPTAQYCKLFHWALTGRHNERLHDCINAEKLATEIENLNRAMKERIEDETAV